MVRCSIGLCSVVCNNMACWSDVRGSDAIRYDAMSCDGMESGCMSIRKHTNLGRAMPVSEHTSLTVEP